LTDNRGGDTSSCGYVTGFGGTSIIITTTFNNMDTTSKGITFIKGTGNAIITADRGVDTGSGGGYTTVLGTGIIVAT